MADGFALPDDVRPPLTLGRGAPGARPLTIGLVNNMPDAALSTTEAQFARLLSAAAGGRTVRLMLFALPGVPRSEAARTAMAERYRSTDSLPSTPVDALIVTGAEPVAADLKDEPFWPQMAGLIDWAERNTVSTVFSCLAAHAAVLRLDDIRRRPLPAKRSGVFEVQAEAHPLTEGLPALRLVPHSRWNGLDEGELRAAGYRILTRSDAVGVDAFVREGRSLMLLLQGHPEYDADALMLEYRRDLRRFLLGERATHPAVPAGYFDPDVERALIALAAATAVQTSLAALSECARIIRLDPPTARWARTSERLYRNWLALVAARAEAVAAR